MYKKLIYDFPTRILHWFLAIGITLAVIFSKGFDDESLYFDFHKLIGLSLIAVLFLRLILGLIGGHYTRFKSYNLSINQLINYLKNNTEYPGHNPGSSFAALFIYVSTVGLIFSGLGMSKIAIKDTAEEMHELFFIVLIISIVFHLTGLVKNLLSTNSSTTFSMINGNKLLTENIKIETKNNTTIGVIFLALLLSNIYFLFNRFDKSSRILNTGFVQLKIGESENELEGDNHDDDD